jgi:SAM-dependent methyltransferase
MLRSAMTGHPALGLLSAPEHPQVTRRELDALRRQHEAVWELVHAGGYAELTALITGLEAATRAAADDEIKHEARELLTDTCQAAAATMAKAGEGDAAWVAADRGAPAAFDAVLCHGVLMYFPDPGPLLDVIARVVVPGGIVSLLVRNGDALAMRPRLLGVWDKAGRAFDGESYLNRIGVSARLEDLTSALAQSQIAVSRWYGVRVFTGTVASGEPVPARQRWSPSCGPGSGPAGPARTGMSPRCWTLWPKTKANPASRCSRAAAPDGTPLIGVTGHCSVAPPPAGDRPGHPRNTIRPRRASWQSCSSRCRRFLCHPALAQHDHLSLAGFSLGRPRLPSWPELMQAGRAGREAPAPRERRISSATVLTAPRQRSGSNNAREPYSQNDLAMNWNSGASSAAAPMRYHDQAHRIMCQRGPAEMQQDDIQPRQDGRRGRQPRRHQRPGHLRGGIPLQPPPQHSGNANQQEKGDELAGEAHGPEHIRGEPVASPA